MRLTMSIGDTFTSVEVNTHAPGSPLVIYGLVLLLVLFAAPSGVAGLVRRLTARWA